MFALFGSSSHAERRKRLSPARPLYSKLLELQRRNFYERNISHCHQHFFSRSCKQLLLYCRQVLLLASTYANHKQPTIKRSTALGAISAQADLGCDCKEKSLHPFFSDAREIWVSWDRGVQSVRCMRIEASCQTVVTTRLKRAGMCWIPEGLDAILPLRTSMLNCTYDDFWEHRSRLVA